MITLGGQPLLLPDSDGELLRWQEAFQNARQYDLFAEPAALKSGRTGSRRESNTTAVGLPIPNYPDPPEPRINTLYWPTGATRWARGYFLADSAITDAIIKKSSNYSTAITLAIDSSGETPLRTTVYLLPPRPITYSKDVNAAQQLWLIPVVDERYFWNFSYSNVDLNTDPATSWSGLFNFLFNGLAAQNFVFETAPTISPADDYLIPDKQELQRRYDNAASLIDAICLSTGYRFVTKFNGVHKPETASDSIAIVDARESETFQYVAGRQSVRLYSPVSSTLVAFNKFKHGRILESGEKYTKEIPLSTSGLIGYSAATRIVHSSVLADYSTGVLFNSAACDDLATQIEADYSAWSKKQYDFTIAGVSDNLIPCGHDDSITITFGAQRWNEAAGEYEYEAHTRIKSYPLNFGVECQLSQDPYIRVVSHFQDAIPAENVTAGTSGNFYFYDAAGDLIVDENDDPKAFEVHNEWGPDLVEDPLTGTGADYDRVRVHWQEETEKWEIVKVKNLPRRGKSSGAITGGSGTVQAYDESGTLITGYTVGVTSVLGDVADAKWVIYDWINGHWEIVSAECD